MSEPALNTDRELYREDTGDPAGSYYENSLHVTAEGAIGMNVGGTVIVQPIAKWHEQALRTTAPPPSAAVPDPADVEKAARELYRQWREDSGGDPADLPDWECLNEDCGDEDEPDLRGAYRRRAVLILAAVRPSPDSEAVARVEALADVAADRIRAALGTDAEDAR